MSDLGRFRQIERTGDALGSATKVKIAEFNGPHYVAERDGDVLCIYEIGSDGLPGVLTGDDNVNACRELNWRNAPLREPRNDPRRR